MTTLTVYTKTGNTIKLTDANFIASGGEGKVYKTNSGIVKIYHEPLKAKQNGLNDKIEMLSHIQHKFIISPEESVYDKNGDFVGYRMPFCDGQPIVKTFTNSWRNQNNFTEKSAINLVENMQYAIKAAHDHKAIIVDGNEMNYLFENETPYLIDVDSWQIDRFKGTAIMPSIIDHHSKEFNKNTDWFAWGIVSFQVLTGIHPYKGTHPDFQKSDLKGRMTSNISVFDNKISLNHAVRDFSIIPSNLKSWYEEVFQNGFRGEPPSALVVNPTKAQKKTYQHRQVGSTTIKYQKIHNFSGDIVKYFDNNLFIYVQGNGFKLYDWKLKKEINLPEDKIQLLLNEKAGIIRNENYYIFGENENNLVKFLLVGNSQSIQISYPTAQCVSVVQFGNALFVLNNNINQGFMKVEATTIGQKIMIGFGMDWQLSVNSTKKYKNCFIASALGTPVFMFFNEQLKSFFNHIIENLVNCTVLDCYATNQNCVAILYLNKLTGNNEIGIFQLSNDKMVLAIKYNTDFNELNFATNSNNVVFGMTDEKKAIVFISNPNTGSGFKYKEIIDDSISSRMTLIGLEDVIAYYDGIDIYKISLT